VKKIWGRGITPPISTEIFFVFENKKN